MNCCNNPHHGRHVHVDLYQHGFRYRTEHWTKAQQDAWHYFTTLLYHFGITVIY